MAELSAVCEDEESIENDQNENLMLKMYKAIDTGNVALFNELLDIGGDMDSIFVDEANISTKSLLHICCEKGQLGCVQTLIDRGAYLSARDNWGQTPLMFSVLADRRDVAEMLLTHEPSLIGDSDKYGESCLHFAANNGMLEFMNILFKYGTVPDKANQSGYTPLMTSILSRDIENSRLRCDVIKLLIAHGSNYEMREPRGRRSSLQLAVLARDADVVEILLQAGADPNSLDRGGRTALTNCILENIIVPREPGSMPIIDDNIQSMIILLTQAGTNMNLSLCEYSHPLICVSFVGSLHLVQFFMENGSLPDLSSNCFPSGVTPILTAASRNQITIVKHFLSWGCCFNEKGRITRKQTDYSFDCFELAIFLKYWDLAKLLLKVGYHWKPNQIDKDENLRESLETSEEMTEWYNSFVRTPQSLMFYSIRTIRESLGSNIPSKYKKLELPKSINDQILLKDVLSLEES